jgi:TRAP-type C4-dicarboxylate transport system substrate-binding protein
MVFMAQDRYDALPDDAKAALDANSGCETTRQLGEIVVQWEEESKAFVAAQEGHTISAMSAEDFAAIKDELAPRVFQAFADRVEGGEELLNAYAAAVEKAMADR